jgi:hypothetical protein
MTIDINIYRTPCHYYFRLATAMTPKPDPDWPPVIGRPEGQRFGGRKISMKKFR